MKVEDINSIRDAAKKTADYIRTKLYEHDFDFDNDSENDFEHSKMRLEDASCYDLIHAILYDMTAIEGYHDEEKQRIMLRKAHELWDMMDTDPREELYNTDSSAAELFNELARGE